MHTADGTLLEIKLQYLKFVPCTHNTCQWLNTDASNLSMTKHTLILAQSGHSGYYSIPGLLVYRITVSVNVFMDYLSSKALSQADLSWDRQCCSFSAARASALRNACTETDPCAHASCRCSHLHSVMCIHIPTPFVPCRKNACAWTGSFRSARPLSPWVLAYHRIRVGMTTIQCDDDQGNGNQTAQSNTATTRNAFCAGETSEFFFSPVCAPA